MNFAVELGNCRVQLLQTNPEEARVPKLQSILAIILHDCMCCYNPVDDECEQRTEELRVVWNHDGSICNPHEHDMT